MTPPRLFVVPAAGSAHAMILRRGPARQVAALGWNRDTDEVTLGQWLKGRIYEFRCDLSPDGRHFVYFAGTGDPDHPSGGWWTAVSRAPYLHALHFFPKSDTWSGGGAFTPDGECWLNGSTGAWEASSEIRFCTDPAAFPHSTDGFWMGELYATRMELRGWARTGTGYDVVLRKPLADGWALRWWVETGQKNRALVAGRYALEHSAGAGIDLPDWEWADLWQGELQVAEKGQLKAVALENGRLRDTRLIRDFGDMEFEAIAAPYDTRSTRERSR
ncbi:hypothetical protein AAFO92_20475 [Roseovarius sp. CAU 1744]|uniref:hypothetical protein n=1 Tax=Roseovarius sp. CAU 1744 TaxID=3140368 RepID=UPI00325B0837